MRRSVLGSLWCLLANIPTFFVTLGYERNYPITSQGEVDHSAVIDKHTYIAKPGSLIHFTQGNAGNVESHSTLGPDEPILNTTAVLNEVDYGFASFKVHNKTHASYTFVKGADGSAGDYVFITKPERSSS